MLVILVDQLRYDVFSHRGDRMIGQRLRFVIRIRKNGRIRGRDGSNSGLATSLPRWPLAGAAICASGA